MNEEYILVLLVLIIIFLLYSNSNTFEYMNSSPFMFLPEGYGEHGQYYDNIDIEPVYRTIKVPTIFD